MKNTKPQLTKDVKTKAPKTESKMKWNVKKLFGGKNDNSEEDEVDLQISKYVLRGPSGPKDPVLVVTNLTKRFGDFVAADNVSFKVERGERVAIIGANGAGKTTVTEIVAGLSKPSSGTIQFGFDFDKSPQEGVGMQFQKADYPSGLTVADMIGFADKLRKLKTPKERMNELLETFQMTDFYKRKAKNLSGGQKQKLNILMSVLHKPRLIILDELSTGLDISAREEIIDFTDKLLAREKMSAIVISHHFEEIEKLCTKIIAMDRGKIVRIALIKDLIAEHGSLSNFARDLIGGANKAVKDGRALEEHITSSSIPKTYKNWLGKEKTLSPKQRARLLIKKKKEEKKATPLSIAKKLKAVAKKELAYELKQENKAKKAAEKTSTKK